MIWHAAILILFKAVRNEDGKTSEPKKTRVVEAANQSTLGDGWVLRLKVNVLCDGRIYKYLFFP